MIYTDTKVVRSTLRGLNEEYDFIAQQGATYSGKSYGIILALVIFMMKNKDKRLTVRVVGQTTPHLKDGVLEDFLGIAYGFKVINRSVANENKYWIGKSTIKFMTVDKVGKAKGNKFDITFINEANYIPYNIVRQLILRTNLCTIIDFNPVAKFWFHEKIVKDKTKKLLFKRTTYLDNPSVSEKKKSEIEGLKDVDMNMYRVYALGMTGSIEGLVFPEIEIVYEFPSKAKKIGYGLDFGYANSKTAFVKCGIIGNRLYCQQLIYETELTNQDISKKLTKLGISKLDRIAADSAEPKSIEELHREGWRIRKVKKGKDSVTFGIGLMKNYKICVTRESYDLIRDFQNYKYKEERDGTLTNKPIKKFDDGIDAVRYHCMTHLNSSFKRIIHGYSRTGI
jgi:phage terminase large subunit